MAYFVSGGTYNLYSVNLAYDIGSGLEILEVKICVFFGHWSNLFSYLFDCYVFF